MGQRLPDQVPKAAWKVVIHRENPGVQKPPQGLRTFQTASYTLDTVCVATNPPDVPGL